VGSVVVLVCVVSLWIAGAYLPPRPQGGSVTIKAPLTQTTVEYDVNSDGSAKVTLTMQIINRSNSSFNAIDMGFPQSVITISIENLLDNRELTFLVMNSTQSEVDIRILLGENMTAGSIALIQVMYSQTDIAYTANTTDLLLGVRTLIIGLPTLANSRLIVKYPSGTQPFSTAVSPHFLVAGKEEYVDTDGRWVDVWASGNFQSSAIMLEYELQTRLWAFVFAPLITLGAVWYVSRIIRNSAVPHAIRRHDRQGAYTLWEMSLALHVGLLAVLASSWGLVLAQEPPSFPSSIDFVMGTMLLYDIQSFVRDTSTHSLVIQSIP
jgi:hypothetical protein